MDNDVKKTSPSLEERTFELNMRSMFKEAKKIEDIPTRIKESKNLLEYFEGHDSSLRSEIEESIRADENSIYEGFVKSKELESKVESLTKDASRAKELESTVESLNKTIASLNQRVKENDSLKEEFENACTLLDSMKDYSEKQEEMVKIANAERNARVPVSEYKEALSYSEELEEENKKLKRTISALRRRINSLLEAAKKSEEEDDDEDEDEDNDDEDEKKASGKKSPEKSEEPEDDDEDEKDSEDDDEDEDEDDDEKKESYSVYKGLNPDVIDYYEDLEYRNPRVVKIKEEILSKHTLLEAQKTYLKLRSFVEDRDTKIYTSGKKKYVESTKKNYQPLHEGWV